MGLRITCGTDDHHARRDEITKPATDSPSARYCQTVVIALAAAIEVRPVEIRECTDNKPVADLTIITNDRRNEAAIS